MSELGDLLGVSVVETDDGPRIMPQLDLDYFLDTVERIPRPDLMLYAYVGMLVHPPRPILNVINLS